jgi:hypothetical protein
MRKHPTLWSSVAWVCLVLLASLCARAHHAREPEEAGARASTRQRALVSALLHGSRRLHAAAPLAPPLGAREQAMDVPRHQVRTRRSPSRGRAARTRPMSRLARRSRG